MDVKNHNIRTVMVSADLVGQSVKGDPSKIVQTKDTYEPQNDLEGKKQDKDKKQKNTNGNDAEESDASASSEKPMDTHINVGRQIDLNA